MSLLYCDINSIPNIDIARTISGNACTKKSGTCTDQEKSCFYSYTLGKSREKLDADLQEIYQPETSRARTFQTNLETTMLTGIVWAMLGTTVLYYAFTKI
jgi:hypothetical protein